MDSYCCNCGSSSSPSRCSGAREAPSVTAAQDGTYKPLSRPLFIYVKKDALSRPEVAAFMQYVLDNETAIAEASQFVPLTDEQLTKAKNDLEMALGS